MRAWTQLLLIAPVSNNWMWVDDMPKLTSLIALKWQGLTPWHAQVLTGTPIQPEITLQQQQAQAILTIQLNSAQTELHLRLNTPSHLAQTHLNLSMVGQNLDIPLKTLETLAVMVTEWLAQQLTVCLDAAATDYEPAPDIALLGFITEVWHGDLDKAAAETKMAEWHTKYPDVALVPRLLGERCIQGRHHARAIQYLQLAAKLTPEKLVSLRSKDATMAGLCAILAGQPVIGQRWMEAAITWSPMLPSPRLHLGLTLESLGQVDLALKHLLVYHEMVPDDSRALYALTRLYALRQDWAQVVQSYQALLSIQEPDGWLYCDLANAYLQMGEEAQAQQWFQKAIDQCPPDHPVVEMARLALNAPA